MPFGTHTFWGRILLVLFKPQKWINKWRPLKTMFKDNGMIFKRKLGLLLDFSLFNLKLVYSWQRGLFFKEIWLESCYHNNWSSVQNQFCTKLGKFGVSKKAIGRFWKNVKLTSNFLVAIVWCIDSRGSRFVGKELKLRLCNVLTRLGQFVLSWGE